MTDKSNYMEGKMDLLQRRRNTLDPFGEFDRLQREINELFDIGTASGSRGLYDRSVSPALDVLENDDSFIVRADLPGMTGEEIELSAASGVLTLKGNEEHGGKHQEKSGKKERPGTANQAPAAAKQHLREQG
jgi:HSP20 family molecular chaperone IbpA